MRNTFGEFLTAVKNSDKLALREMGVEADRIGDGGFATRHICNVVDAHKDNGRAEWLKLRVRLEAIEDCSSIALHFTDKMHGSSADSAEVSPTERNDAMLLRDALLELKMLITGIPADDSAANFRAHMERKRKFNEEAERAGSPIRMKGVVGCQR